MALVNDARVKVTKKRPFEGGFMRTYYDDIDGLAGLRLLVFTVLNEQAAFRPHERSMGHGRYRTKVLLQVGQTISSTAILAKRCETTLDKIRGALKSLEEEGRIISERKSTGSIFTLVGMASRGSRDPEPGDYDDEGADDFPCESPTTLCPVVLLPQRIQGKWQSARAGENRTVKKNYNNKYNTNTDFQNLLPNAGAREYDPRPANWEEELNLAFPIFDGGPSAPPPQEAAQANEAEAAPFCQAQAEPAHTPPKAGNTQPKPQASAYLEADQAMAAVCRILCLPPKGEELFRRNFATTGMSVQTAIDRATFVAADVFLQQTTHSINRIFHQGEMAKFAKLCTDNATNNVLEDCRRGRSAEAASENLRALMTAYDQNLAEAFIEKLIDSVYPPRDQLAEDSNESKNW